MFELNAPKGLGDAIYLRAVVLHLLALGERVKVYTPWPDVFVGLPIEIAPPAASGSSDWNLHSVTACLHCEVPLIRAMDKFTLACAQAGIAERIELKINWVTRNTGLVEDIKRRAAGRRVMIYQTVKRARNPVQEMWQPHRAAFNRFVAGQKDCFRVKLGHPDFTVTDESAECEIDLAGKVSVTDVFDIASAAALIFGEDCFLPVLAQAMDRPFVCMFSSRGLNSNQRKIFCLTPERAFNKPHLGTAIFDE